MEDSRMTKDELWQFIEETEELTEALKEELRREELHEAIDNLPQLLEEAKGKWSNLGLLLEQIVIEMKERKKERE